MLTETIERIYEEMPEIERMASAHNIASNTDALSALPQKVVDQVQEAIREQYGDTLTLYHGSEAELSADIEWHENTSFTDEFDIEFAGEDGYIIIAQVPADRIKFYLDDENEFVLTAGKLDCTVYTVAEYFGL